MEYVLIVLLLVYLAPFTLAAGRDHPRARSILVLNLTLGWTGVGWLAALAWAWPDPTPGPRLHLVPDTAPGPESRTGPPRHGGPWLGIPAAAGAAVAIAAAPTVWPQASWWPEPQRGVFDAHVETLGPEGATLRPRAGGGAPLGRLPPRCPVWVVDHRSGWKRIWRTAACLEQAPGAAEGWIPAHRAHPRRVETGSAGSPSLP